MNDPMNVDTLAWGAGLPAHGIQCFNCKQFGHKSNKCPMPRNGSNNNRQNQNFKGNRNHQESNRATDLKQPWRNRPQLVCENCPGKNNHTTEDCRKKPRQQNNSGTNSTGPGFGSDANYQGPASRNQYPPSAQITSKPYCEACNSTEHTDEKCLDDDAIRRMRRSVFRCQKCGLKGHTRDDCRNPIAATCWNCHRPGHYTSECRASKFVFGDILLSTANRSSERFKWRLPGPERGWTLGPGQQSRLELARMQEEARQRGETLRPDIIRQAEAIIKDQESSLSRWGQGTSGRSQTNLPNASSGGIFPSTVQTNPPAANNVADDSHISGRNRQIRDHIDRSACLYHKHNANRNFLRYERQIVASKALSAETLLKAKMLIAQGAAVFWRDPKAMQAIAQSQKPRCRSCGKDGVFLDRFMRGIPAMVDVLTVEDFKDWGLFVMFSCRCCNQGFDYVSR